MFVITLELKSGLTFDSANSLSLHSKEMKIKSEPSRSRCWILILFWKPSFKFQKCLYTCKAAAAVAQSSLVGCKIFRPSWDVKLVLLGPRHPFFFDPFLFLLRSSICPFYSDFYVKTIGSPHLFVNVTHTIHWDSETFQWTLAKHWIEMAIPEIGFSIICVF